MISRFVVASLVLLVGGFCAGDEKKDDKKDDKDQLQGEWLVVSADVRGKMVAGLVLTVTGVAPADKVQGTIKSVGETVITVTDKDKKDWAFTFYDRTKVSIDGKYAEITDLVKGQEVTVTYKKCGDSMDATEIVAKKK